MESLLEAPVHEMGPEELAEYIKRCAVLRSSAQTRKATLKKESDAATGKKPKAKKDNISYALELLAKIQPKT